MMCGKKYLIIDGLICAAIYSAVLFLAFYKYDFGNNTFIIVVAVIAGLYFFGLAYKSFMLLADIVTLPRDKIVKFVRIGEQEHLNIFLINGISWFASMMGKAIKNIFALMIYY